MKNNSYYTNKINFNINKLKLLDDYDLIEIKLNNNIKKSDYSKVWLSLKDNISVLSHYKNKLFIYLLTSKNEIRKTDFNESNILGELYSIKLLDFQAIKKVNENILLNLLISLSGSSLNMFSLGEFQNGCFLVNKIENNKVITLKFFVDSNSLLNINVNTFVRIKCTKENKNKYIFYIIENNKLIRIINPSESMDDLYIRKNKFKRSSVTFMEFTNQFLESKVGQLSIFLQNLSIVLKDYLDFNLEQKKFNIYNTGLNKAQRVDELRINIIDGFLKFKRINLIDYENNMDVEYKKELVNKINLFFNKSIKVRFVKIINKDIPSFVFLFSKDKYKNNDPYKNIKKRFFLTQIISYKNSKKLINTKSDNVFLAVLKELYIKIEIVKEEFHLTNKWSFFRKYDYFINTSSNKYKKITLIDNKISINDLTLLDEIKLLKIKELDVNNSNIELIGLNDNDYFLIERTKEFTLPNLNKCLDIYNDFLVNNKKPALRLTKYRKDTVYFSLGINYIKYDNCIEYYSTTNNMKNPNKAQSKSNLIRKIYFSDKEFDYYKILDSLDEYFIRNNTFTVLPFICKYINEFTKMNELKNPTI